MEIVPAVPAPDFKQISSWKNSDPLSIGNLKGSVILIDLWTYTCIFCLRTLPLMTLLNNKYSKYGLRVIQAHSAEYDFARITENVENALSYYKLDRIPVAIDNRNKTWEAYGDSYWPKHVLIDSNGFVRYEHAGYGRITDFEAQVRELLEEAGNTISEPREENEPHDDIYEIYGMQFDGIAPETCVGYSRLRKFGNRQKMKPNVLNTAIDQDEHLDNVVYLRGPWIWENEGVRACPKVDATASIVMKYNAATRVHVIMGTIDGTDTTTKIYLDGEPVENDQLGRNVALVNGSSICTVKHPIIYNLINTQTAGTHEIEIVASSDNTIIYTFVFG
ncbi:MAG TPA: redoxin family protein [Nitrososphaeraceae archaeon]